MKRESEILIRFGKKVREFRAKKGLSQEAFSSECGLDRTYVSDVELGKRNIGLKNVDVIALALGVRVSDLFKE